MTYKSPCFPIFITLRIWWKLWTLSSPQNIYAYVCMHFVLHSIFWSSWTLSSSFINTVVAQERHTQTRALLKCLWDSEKPPQRTRRCEHDYYHSHYRGAHRRWGLVGERLHLLQSETPYKGSQTKEAHVPHMTLKDIVSVCKRVKKLSQDKKLLPKGDKEGVTIHSQNNAHCFLASGCLTRAPSWEGEGPCALTPRLSSLVQVLHLSCWVIGKKEDGVFSDHPRFTLQKTTKQNKTKQKQSSVKST